MDTLVHHGAAAIESERTAPSGGIIIGLRAPPRNERARHGQFTKPTGVERGFKRNGTGAKSARQDASDCDAGLSAGGGESIASGEGDLEGLLDDDVLAGLGAGEGRGEVVAAGRAEADDVNVRVSEERLRRLGKSDAVLGREVTSLTRGAVVSRDELHPGDLSESLRMELGDHAGSPDAETKGPLGHAYTLAETVRGGEG